MSDARVAEARPVVLVVDDEADIGWALGRLVERSGAAPVLTTSAAAALHVLEQQRPRLVFLDAKLPDADGVVLARQMRTMCPTIRIVLMSGYFYGDDTQVLESSGAGIINGFLGKPFSHEEVRAIVRAMLTDREGLPE